MSKSTKIIAGLGAVAMLGVSAMPLAGIASAATTGDVTVQYGVAETLSLEIVDGAGVGTTEHVYDTVDNLTAGAFDTTYTHTLLVNTNADEGYKITVAPATSESGNTALTNTANGATIPSFSTVQTSITAESPTGWGLKATLPSTTGMTYTSDFSGGYLGVGQTISSELKNNVVTSSDVAALISDDTTTINYGVKTADNQASGVYGITLTYTAAAN